MKKIFILILFIYLLRVDAQKPTISQEVDCSLCKMIVGFVDQMLKMNATDSEIENFLDNDVCPLVAHYNYYTLPEVNLFSYSLSSVQSIRSTLWRFCP
jgi:hypothetical protein